MITRYEIKKDGSVIGEIVFYTQSTMTIMLKEGYRWIDIKADDVRLEVK